MQVDEINSCFYTFRDLKVAKCQKAVCGDIRHHEKAKCWKGQAAKRGQFGAKKANIHWFKKLKRAGKGQAWCKKANIYWLKEWSHIGRHLLQRLFRNGWSRNNLNLLKKEKNKNTTSLLKYNTTHLSRTFPLFQGAHTQNHPLALHRKREDTKGTNALFAISSTWRPLKIRNNVESSELRKVDEGSFNFAD